MTDYFPAIRFDSGGVLVRDARDLPQVPARIHRLYADFETTSGDPKLTATNPWHHCSAIGVAVAFDDGPVYFVPRELLVTGWWRDVLAATDYWVNHHVKYDMHVSANDLGVVPKCKVVCTLTGAKLIDSDRGTKGGYGLDALSKDLLDRDIGEFYWQLLPYLDGNKDYGRVPLELLAEYACVDVDVARGLDQYVTANMPEESGHVWAVEQGVTGLLFEIEQTGVCVDPTNIKVKKLQVLSRMLQLDEEIERLVGRPINPVSGDDVYDVLINQYGLPVLAWTDAGGASFDKDAIKQYLVHPLAPKEIVARIGEYRKLSTFNSLFLDTYEREQVDGRMHGSYNQAVRTGRMSCSGPNMQQLSGLAKELIIPPPGYGVVSADGSQIEFRFIVHYINNPACIAAYHRDPWTDFHQWVAGTVGTRRKPAKTINFMLGYGGGKKRTVSALSVNDEVVGDVLREVAELDVRDEARQQLVRQMCEQRALKVYDTYHRTLPELKPTSKQAEMVCRKRGYARNWFGRRRHLPPDHAHKAFNSLNQSSAGDYLKERMLAVREEVPELIQVAQVHDQILGYAPLELLEDPEERLCKRVAAVMNETSRPLNVPLRTSVGWSPLNWKHAQSDEREKKFH